MVEQFFGVASVVVTLIQYTPYCWGTYRGQLRPHVFSYVIWGLGAAIVAAAQWTAGAGPGAWSMGLVALLCFFVALLSLRRGSKYITRGDILTFSLAMLAIPLWYHTEDALFAVAIITGVDLAAFYMILRKASTRPGEDSIEFYAISMVQYSLSLFAIQEHNITSVLNPAVAVFSTGVVIALLYTVRDEKSAPHP